MVKEEMSRLAERSEYMILSGSLPKGLKDDSYAELIHILKDSPARIIVDTSGPALQHVLEAGPYMIKPNKEELEGILGKTNISEHVIIETLKDWRQLGIPLIVVSLGSEGAIVSIEDELYKVEAPKISEVN